VIGANVLPGLSYRPFAEKLYAANESVVPIAGSTELQYKTGGIEMKNEVLISEAIEELILEEDWSSEYQCT
jgi:hypothetical protein